MRKKERYGRIFTISSVVSKLGYDIRIKKYKKQKNISLYGWTLSRQITLSEERIFAVLIIFHFFNS